MIRGALACLVLSLVGKAATLISFGDGMPHGAVGFNLSGTLTSAAATSWTQTVTTTNTSILAALDSQFYSGTNPGTAWLMTSIGPASTTSSQIASGTFFAPQIVPSNLDTQPDTLLFSGLTLGPGTYYLILAGPTDLAANDSGYIWWGDQVPLASIAAGFTLNSDYDTISRAAYIPASGFTPVATGGGRLFYQVNGNISLAPEPSSLLLVLFSAGLLYGFKTKVSINETA